MPFNNEQFEAAYLDLLAKYDVPGTVLIYRDGCTMCVRGTATNPLDNLAVTLIVKQVKEHVMYNEALRAEIKRLVDAYIKEHPDAIKKD